MYERLYRISKVFKTVGNSVKGAIKALVINVNNVKSSNWIPVIGHLRDRSPITWQIGARRTNHDREFCYRYNYAWNGGHTPHNKHRHTLIFILHPYHLSPIDLYLQTLSFALYLKSFSTLLLIGKLRWQHKNCVPGLTTPLSPRPSTVRGVRTLDLDFKAITAKSVSKLTGF